MLHSNQLGFLQFHSCLNDKTRITTHLDLTTKKPSIARLFYLLNNVSYLVITGKSGTMSSATMLIILMSGFTAGPAVSL
jgi:hypothetical protein